MWRSECINRSVHRSSLCTAFGWCLKYWAPGGCIWRQHLEIGICCFGVLESLSLYMSRVQWPASGRISFFVNTLLIAENYQYKHWSDHQGVLVVRSISVISWYLSHHPTISLLVMGWWLIFIIRWLHVMTRWRCWWHDEHYWWHDERSPPLLIWLPAY